MNWLDVVLGLILAASVAAAFRRGLTREVIGLVSVVLGFVLGLWFYGWAGSFLAPHLKSPQAADFAGFGGAEGAGGAGEVSGGRETPMRLSNIICPEPSKPVGPLRRMVS